MVVLTRFLSASRSGFTSATRSYRWRLGFAAERTASSNASRQIWESPVIAQARYYDHGRTTMTSDGSRRGVCGDAVANQATISSTQKLFASVVKIFCDHTDPNFCQPWQMRRQGSSSGSGFAVEGRRIMTNAHCVAYQNRILVRKHGDARRFPAEVIAVAHECDLALISVDDDSIAVPQFWEGLPPLQFGGLPELHDSVVVVGYPTGGDNLSVTAGIVSRLDVTTYAHSNFKLLCAQIDAAINPGNSGGPAFRVSDGSVAGVAFQGYGDAQNIGYIVPTCVIRHFLADVEKHKKYTGFVTLGITYQSMENEILRRFYGLEEVKQSELPNGITATGILVVQVDESRKAVNNDQKLLLHEQSNNLDVENVPRSTTVEDIDGKGLKKNDILMSLNEVDIANDGTIHFRGRERVHLSHITSRFFSSQTVSAVVLRNKQIVTVEVDLYPPSYLVPEHQWDKMARYFIFGGLVFCPLTLDYLKDEFGKKYYERAPTQLMVPLADFFRTSLDEEVVILSQILASDLTIGYDVKNSRLRKVNGFKINNLRHLLEILANTKHQPFVNFEFDHEIQVILDRAATEEKTPDILKQHAIAQICSEDLKPFIETLSC